MLGMEGRMEEEEEEDDEEDMQLDEDMQANLHNLQHLVLTDSGTSGNIPPHSGTPTVSG